MITRFRTWVDWRARQARAAALHRRAFTAWYLAWDRLDRSVNPLEHR